MLNVSKLKLQLDMKESKFLKAALNAVDLTLVTIIALFMMKFKIRLPDLTGGVPTMMALSWLVIFYLTDIEQYLLQQ